jgi:hypothetical protein
VQKIMTPVPIHIAIDLEPDERMPEGAAKSFDNAGVAFEEMMARRSDIERATGAQAHFGWYVRMDRQIQALYGDANAIADRYRLQLTAAEGAGDEVGLHVHSIEPRANGGWRANYADASLIDAIIEESVSNFRDVFGRPCRAARLGDMWSSRRAAEKFAALGVRYDLSRESGLRSLALSKNYPGTNSLGRSPSMLGIPVGPFNPLDNAVGPQGEMEDLPIWSIPLSSTRRCDFHRPGMWLVSAYSALTTGFRRCRARMVIRPQVQYAPGALRIAIESLFAECAQPSLCVAVRNFGAADRIHHFLDVVCEIARERPVRFVTPLEYVRLWRSAAP